MHACQLVALTWMCFGLATPTRIAQAQAEQGSAAPAQTPLEQAKDEFRRGVALLNADDTEGALADFLRSRALVASGKNTVDAAICLERLGRYDEALELYEEVVQKFAADLPVQDRQNLGPVMASLTAKLAYLQLSANVDGQAVVAGRARGHLPLATALRVLPGPHVIRIFKAGYRPFETVLDFNAGETRQLAARLQSLSAPVASAVGDSSRRASDKSTRRTLAWTASIASVVQLGAAGYFGVRAFELHAQNNDAAASSVADASTVLTITGLASSAAALYLFMTSNQRLVAPTNAAQKAPSVDLARNEILITGRF